jgi:hypothetical protein
VRELNPILAALCLALGCADGRCNPSNCQLLLSCHSILQGATDSTCFSSVAAVDFFADSGQQYCVDACNADSEGALLGCVADHFSAQSCQAIALDGGDTTNAIEETCGDLPAACAGDCQSCQAQCAQAQQSCNQGCMDGGAVPSACFACNYACNQAVVQCEGKCPND